MFCFLELNSVWDPSPTLHLLGLACRDSAAYGCLGPPVCPTTTWATLTIFPDMTSGISYVSLFLKVKKQKKRYYYSVRCSCSGSLWLLRGVPVSLREYRKASAEIINNWVTTLWVLVVSLILQSAMGLVGKGESRFGVSRGCWNCPLICEGNVCTQLSLALGSHYRGYAANFLSLDLH